MVIVNTDIDNPHSVVIVIVDLASHLTPLIHLQNRILNWRNCDWGSSWLILTSTILHLDYRDAISTKGEGYTIEDGHGRYYPGPSPKDNGYATDFTDLQNRILNSCNYDRGSSWLILNWAIRNCLTAHLLWLRIVMVNINLDHAHSQLLWLRILFQHRVTGIWLRMVMVDIDLDHPQSWLNQLRTQFQYRVRCVRLRMVMVDIQLDHLQSWLCWPSSISIMSIEVPISTQGEGYEIEDGHGWY